MISANWLWHTTILGKKGVNSFLVFWLFLEGENVGRSLSYIEGKFKTFSESKRKPVFSDFVLELIGILEVPFNAGWSERLPTTKWVSLFLIPKCFIMSKPGLIELGTWMNWSWTPWGEYRLGTFWRHQSVHQQIDFEHHWCWRHAARSSEQDRHYPHSLQGGKTTDN